MTEHEPADPNEPYGLGKAGKVRMAIEKMGNGDRASLRRALGHRASNPDSLPSPAFYWLLSRVIDPESKMGRNELERQHREDLWLLICASLAELDGLTSKASLGAALRDADFSEMRMLRLLRADRSNLREMLRPAIHMLVSKGKPVSPWSLAYFVLSIDNQRRKQVRRKLARDFFQEKKTN